MASEYQLSSVFYYVSNQTEYSENALYHLVSENKEFWLVVDNSDKKYPYHVSGQKLLVFVYHESAVRFISASSDFGADVLLKKIPKSDLADVIEKMSQYGLINGVFMYWIPPIGVKFSDLDSLISESLRKKSKASLSFESETEKTRALLELIDEDDRSSLDPNYKIIISNAHSLLKYFVETVGVGLERIATNTNIDPEKLRQYYSDYADSSTLSKEEFHNLLRYLGIGDYLYRFKDDCEELLQQLAENSKLDKYPVVFPKSLSRVNELFTIKELRRARSVVDGAFVYQVLLESPLRSVDVFITNPTGCVIGKKCEVLNLPEIKSDTAQTTTGPRREEERKQKPINVTDVKVDQVAKDFAPKGGGKGRRRPTAKYSPTKPSEGNDADEF